MSSELALKPTLLVKNVSVIGSRVAFCHTLPPTRDTFCDCQTQWMVSREAEGPRPGASHFLPRRRLASSSLTPAATAPRDIARRHAPNGPLMAHEQRLSPALTNTASSPKCYYACIKSEKFTDLVGARP